MLLAVDTSTTQVGLALYDGTRVIAENLWQGKLRHTTTLAPAIDELLKRTNTKMDNISALGVALGPGSFTSLRVGLALVKGIAMARKLPVIGIPTLDMLTAAQPALDLELVAVLQAGRGRLALSRYLHVEGQGWQSDDAPTVMRVEELLETIHKPTLVCGELSGEERESLAKNDHVQLGTPVQCTRRPAFLAELAWKRYQANDTDDAASLSPIYVHVGEPIPS
jgi:tRNA threonylcarbamoyladenosine biosynthesis protein TsaB